MHPLDAVRAFLTKEHLYHVHITVALSGGADSVCLLNCLMHWRKAFDLEISAVHIQHQLRGAESQRDEEFCRLLCEKNGIPLNVIPVDVMGYAKEKHLSVETSARECRYQAFAEHAEGYVATAHTASDNIETILFRLARGTGLKGLCGIPERRDNYLRPLLKANRTEIEAYLHEKQLDFLTDSTNLKDDFSRNFIRHHVMPLLNQIQPGGAERSVMHMTEILQQEEDFLSQTARKAYDDALQPDGSLIGLEKLHPALQRRCICLMLEKHQIPVSYHTVISVQRLLNGGGQCEIVRGEVTAQFSRQQLYLRRKMPTPAEVPLRMGDNQFFPGRILEAEVISQKNFEKSEIIYKLSANSALNYDIIKGTPVLHARKPGLYLKSPGRAHRVSIKKWIQTVPIAQRQTIHYLSDDAGLLWAEGLGVAERAAVSENTENILILHVHAVNTECT